MSQTQKGTLLGKAEWLSSVDIALNGLFGAIALAIAYELAAIVFNPEHTTQVFGLLVLNWHFMNALQLGVFEVGVFVLIVVWKPVKQGLDENAAKLWFVNLKAQYDKLTEALDTEEGKILAEEILQKCRDMVNTKHESNQKSEEQPAIFHDPVLPDPGLSPTSVPWDTKIHPVEPAPDETGR